jgi:hypothetical protein
MKTLIALLVSLTFIAPLAAQQTLTVQEQREISIQRKLINDRRNTAIAYNMTFTQEEKEKFWPLYREYRGAMGKVGDKRMVIITEYAVNMNSMTNPMAKKLLNASIAVEKETIKVQEKYIRKFRRILPETKVARLWQVENRMDTMVEMKMAEGIPLMK